MRRRGFIAGLGGAAAWPFAGHAQQAQRIPRVGVLMPTPEGDPFTRAIVTAFADALQQFGWMQSKNIRVDYRFAAGDPKLFKSYAAKLVGLAPDTILASTTPAIEALSRHTRTIPIVFVLGVDPVGRGWVRASRGLAETSRGLSRGTHL